MPKPKAPKQRTISNRRARHDYILEDSYIVGLSLTGAETKALRLGHGQLTGAYVNARNGQLELVNMLINGTGSVRIAEEEQTRTRPLLAKKKEIAKLAQAKTQGRTIVPLELMTRGHYIKLKIAIAKGKKNYDKRQNLKARSEQRQIDYEVKRSRT